MKKDTGYHAKAQKFIKSAKSKGMKVQAENDELIAYPKGMTPTQPSGVSPAEPRQSLMSKFMGKFKK